MVKLIFLTAALVAVSSGYDFKDSEFNQMILDDIQDIGIQRSKRDTAATVTEDAEKCHGKWKKDMHCCNGDTFDKEEFLKILEAKRGCIKDIWGEEEEPSYDPFNCEQLKEVKEQAICLAECISKKRELIDDKGNIKRDALIEHLKTVFKDTEWKVKATEGIVDKCLASIKDIKIEEKKCNPSAMDVLHCLWKEYIQTCPKELQNDRWKCKKLREKIEKGDENYLKKVHFYKFIRHHEHDHDTETKDKKEE